MPGKTVMISSQRSVALYVEGSEKCGSLSGDEDYTICSGVYEEDPHIWKLPCHPKKFAHPSFQSALHTWVTQSGTACG